MSWPFHPLDYPGPVARSPVIVLADERRVVPVGEAGGGVRGAGPAAAAAGVGAVHAVGSGPGVAAERVVGMGPVAEQAEGLRGADGRVGAAGPAGGRFGGLLGSGGPSATPDKGPVVLPLADPDGGSLGAAGRQEGQLDRLLRRVGAEPMDRRIPVVAVGSNASPRVMGHKFRQAGVSPVAAYLPCQVAGLRVGHSAHVSARGYVAAAPFAAAGARAHVMLVMLTAEQLRALDRTEPNYRRVRLDDKAHPVMCRGSAVAGAWVYESMWGVLSVAGEPLALQRQEELHRILQTWDPVFADHAGGLPPHQVVTRLADARVRQALRRAWSDPALSRPSGLVCSV